MGLRRNRWLFGLVGCWLGGLSGLRWSGLGGSFTLGFGLGLRLGLLERIGLLLGLAPQLQLLGIEIGPQFRRLLAVTQTHVLEAHPRGLLLLKARTQANDIAQVDGAQALGDPVGQGEADPSHQGAHPDPGETTRSRLLGCSGLGHLNRDVGG